MCVLVTCKIAEDQIKMILLEWPQHFPHYNSPGIFPDAKGQLTPQLVIGSLRISRVSVVDVFCLREGISPRAVSIWTGLKYCYGLN